MSKKQLENCDIRDLDGLSSEFLRWFTKLLRPTNAILKKYVDAPPNRGDEVQNMEHMLHLLKTNQELPRMLYQPLLFIKQHRGLLAHYKGCRSSDVKKAIGYLGDVIVCLRLMQEDPECINGYIDFYNGYFRTAKQCVPFNKGVKKEIFEKSIVPPKEDIPEKEEEKIAIEKAPSTSIPTMKISEDFIPPGFCPLPCIPEFPMEPIPIEDDLDTMPQGKTIKWYKKNGYSQEFKMKLVTPVDEEEYRGHYFRVERYNGNNTLMILHGEDPRTLFNARGERLIPNDDGHKFFNSHMAFYWK